MLSNVELIILSLIYEKASYAYEIEKQIEARNMRMWVKIGIASIYQVLSRLSDKGYLEFEIEREGKAPERKRYYLTEKGKEVLKSSVIAAMGKLEWFYMDLNVAFEGSDILSTEEMLETLKYRLQLVKHNLRKIRQDITSDNRKTKAGIIMNNVLAFRLTEEKLLEELIAELAEL